MAFEYGNGLSLFISLVRSTQSIFYIVQREDLELKHLVKLNVRLLIRIHSTRECFSWGSEPELKSMLIAIAEEGSNLPIVHMISHSFTKQDYHPHPLGFCHKRRFQPQTETVEYFWTL